MHTELNECKTIDEIVDQSIKFINFPLTTQYLYHCILIQNGLAILKILRSDSNVPSKHDLLILSESSKMINFHHTYKMIVDEYKNRKV